MTYRGFYEFFVLAAILPCVLALSRPSTMVLENNQYKNMVIAIHESVAEDKKLLDTLKDAMTEASKSLLNATYDRAYFKEITILLPSTWSNDPSYQAVTSETVNMADVIITGTVRPKRSLPQTRSYSGCGKQGVHILLPVDFLTSPGAVPYHNNPGKYFVHAFAQFRWGVFQEYAEAGDNSFYFSLVYGRPEAIRCTIGLRGLVQKNDAQHTICYPANAIDQNTGLYAQDCVWKPYPTHQRVKASIMSQQWITAIETFCNDDTHNYMTLHNYEAPSKHNRLCSHRSTWDVISNTDDFSSGKNPPIGNTPLSVIFPNFKIVRANARRRRAMVVVDDKLQNTDIDTMIARLRHESDLHGIEIATKLESEHTETTYKTEIEPDGLTKNSFDNVVHIKHDCGTDPGMFDPLKDKANRISVLTTNAKSCKYNGTTAIHVSVGRTTGHTLLDRLREEVLQDDLLNSQIVIIQREDIDLSSGDQFTDFVHLDPTIGQKAMFTFHYETGVPDIVIQSPSQVTYNSDGPICSIDEEAKLVKFFFQNTETGEWKYTIKGHSIKQSISIIVFTTPTILKHDPIIVRRRMETSEANQMVLHVDVTQGSRPVVGLNVTANIETPSGRIETLQLYDNGAGADNSKNDGIYSRYFTKTVADGIYHVTASVIGHQGKAFVTEETYLMTGTTRNEEDDPPPQRMITKRSVDGNIQRHVSLGSVHLYPPSAGTSDKDTTPPSRVVDLKVARHLHYRNTLVLTWTASGDDLDHGKVQKNQLYVGQNISDIRAILWFDKIQYNGPGHVVVEEHEGTAEAAETETLLWTIPPYTDKFAFSVRGVDKAGNKAEMSNVATFGFIRHS